MDDINRLRNLSAISQILSQYRPGQYVELKGYRMRVHAVVHPDEYRSYGLVYLEAPKGKMPWLTHARVDEEGIHFEVPEGWLE